MVHIELIERARRAFVSMPERGQLHLCTLTENARPDHARQCVGREY